MIIRRAWIVVAVVTATIAAWMGLGSLHDFQHADSLLTVLISTQRWTPFFWGQDRFGMLVPLLAMPVHDPLANLLTQGWIMTWGALMAPFVMARFLLGRTGGWIETGACANLLLLWIATPAVQFDWLVTQPYGVSISLGFSALIVAGEHRGLNATAAALCLLMLACWVNIGIAVMLAMAAVITGITPLRLLGLDAVAATCASLAARYLASAHTITALAPVAEWPSGWRQLLEGSLAMTVRPAVVVGIAAGTAIAAWRLWTNSALPSWKSLAAVVAMAVGTWLVVGTSLWVGMNRYSFRYMYPTLMVVGVGVAMLFGALWPKRSNAFSAIALAALCIVTAARYGRPSLDRIHRSFDERFGQQTAAVLRSGATVIAGDYWRVWPAVFHANLALARAHQPARVFGLTFRSEETDRLWKTAGRQVLIAASRDDGSVGAVAGEHGVATTLLAHLPEIDLYTGQP